MAANSNAPSKPLEKKPVSFSNLLRPSPLPLPTFSCQGGKWPVLTEGWFCSWGWVEYV